MELEASIRKSMRDRIAKAIDVRLEQSNALHIELLMARSRAWTEDQIVVLKELIKTKVSLPRASVILKRTQASVQIQAHKLGTPFLGVRAAKAALKARIAAAEDLAGIRR